MEKFIEKNINILKEAIVKTIAFFDMFDYPLTVNEVWRNLGVKCELAEIMEVLEGGIKNIDKQNGFYFFSGRESIVGERQKRYKAADRKFKRALRLAKFYKVIPWIRLIAVGNLMGADNLKPESDIDIFIITENKRLWLVRFLCAGLAQVFGLRPRPGKTKDKICLSFFISEQAMDLSPLMIKDDIYFIYWLAGLTPIYDSGSVYKRLIEKNGWLKERLPNWQENNQSAMRDGGLGFSRFYRDVVDMLIGGLEPNFKKLQLRFLSKNLWRLMNMDKRVIMNDKVLKLHSNDRREEYRDRMSNFKVNL